MSDERGMMKYQPYKSLVEQTTILAKMRYQKNKMPKPRISQERAESINEILVSYTGEELEIRYWEDGYIYTKQGTIDKIDSTWKFLQFGGKRIDFRQIVDLKRK